MLFASIPLSSVKLGAWLPQAPAAGEYKPSVQTELVARPQPPAHYHNAFGREVPPPPGVDPNAPGLEFVHAEGTGGLGKGPGGWQPPLTWQTQVPFNPKSPTGSGGELYAATPKELTGPEPAPTLAAPRTHAGLAAATARERGLPVPAGTPEEINAARAQQLDRQRDFAAAGPGPVERAWDWATSPNEGLGQARRAVGNLLGFRYDNRPKFDPTPLDAGLAGVVGRGAAAGRGLGAWGAEEGAANAPRVAGGLSGAVAPVAARAVPGAAEAAAPVATAATAATEAAATPGALRRVWDSTINQWIVLPAGRAVSGWGMLRNTAMAPVNLLRGRTADAGGNALKSILYGQATRGSNEAIQQAMHPGESVGDIFGRLNPGTSSRYLSGHHAAPGQQAGRTPFEELVYPWRAAAATAAAPFADTGDEGIPSLVRGQLGHLRNLGTMVADDPGLAASRVGRGLSNWADRLGASVLPSGAVPAGNQAAAYDRLAERYRGSLDDYASGGAAAPFRGLSPAVGPGVSAGVLGAALNDLRSQTAGVELPSRHTPFRMHRRFFEDEALARARADAENLPTAERDARLAAVDSVRDQFAGPGPRAAEDFAASVAAHKGQGLPMPFPTAGDVRALNQRYGLADRNPGDRNFSFNADARRQMLAREMGPTAEALGREIDRRTVPPPTPAPGSAVNAPPPGDTSPPVPVDAAAKPNPFRSGPQAPPATPPGPGEPPPPPPESVVPTNSKMTPEQVEQGRKVVAGLMAHGPVGAALAHADSLPPPPGFEGYWASLPRTSKILAIAGVSMVGISLLRSMFSSGSGKDDEEDEGFLMKALPFIGLGAAAWGLGGGTLSSLPQGKYYRALGNAAVDKFQGLTSSLRK